MNNSNLNLPQIDIKIISIFILSLFIYLMVAHYSPLFQFSNSNYFSGGIRIISDYFDRNIYSFYGDWAKNHYFPYTKYSFSDLPQLAIYFFGSIWFFTDNINDYLFVFSLSMLFITTAFLIIFMNRLRISGNTKWQILIWFSPISFYYFLNRFDMLPVLFFITSLELLRQKKFTTGGFFFGCSILTKWFTAIALIAIIIYILQNNTNRKTVIHFLFGIAIVMLLCLIFTFATAGLTGILMPYKKQVLRYNSESLYYLIGLFFKINPRNFLFPVFQIIPAIILPFMKKKCNEQEFNALIAIIIINFTVFCPVNSPQWFQWFFPFALLALNMKKWLILFIAIQLASYANFPVIYDVFGPDNKVFFSVISIKILLYILLEIILLLKIFNPEYKHI